MLEGFITFGIFVLVIIIGICVSNNLKSPSEKSYDPSPPGTCQSPPQLSSTMKVNGVDIRLSDSELEELRRKQQAEEYEQLRKDRDILISRIKLDRDRTDDLIRRKVLEEILRHNIVTRSDYEKVEFLYKDGQLRSNEEVERQNKFEETKQNRENFDKERRKVNLLAFFIPFIVGLCIGIAAVGDWFFGIPIGLILGGFAGLIGMAIGHSINIKNAKEYCISDNDPRVTDEKINRTVSIVSTVGAGAFFVL